MGCFIHIKLRRRGESGTYNYLYDKCDNIRKVFLHCVVMIGDVSGYINLKFGRNES